MYTPAIEHSACPLVGGKRGNERTSQVSVPRQYRRNVHYRPTCPTFDNNADAIIISGTVILKAWIHRQSAATHNIIIQCKC